MKVTHIQSSTQIVDLGGVRILTDPWLTEGEYYGSWFHYPPFMCDEFQSLDYDYIYVSHIHPDHISEDTLHLLPYRKTVIIHSFETKFLRRKIESLGYNVVELDHGVPFFFSNGASITIFSADNCNPALCGKFFGCGEMESNFGRTQIDTLALFKYQEYTVLNTNDCPYELAEETIKSNNLNIGKIDLLLVGYAGAGPYPQCFYFTDDAKRVEAANEKKRSFLEQTASFVRLLEPECYAPFAGTYILGSKLSDLNKDRGVPTIEEALQYLMSRVPIASRGLHLRKFDVYDCASKTFTAAESVYSISEEQYQLRIRHKKLAYDDDTWDESSLGSLIGAAYDRFQKKSIELGYESDTSIVIETRKICFIFSTKVPPKLVAAGFDCNPPFVKISLEHNLLHRLLRGPRLAHWNNAEIGSHLFFRREPDVFERGLYHCLYFFHI